MFQYGNTLGNGWILKTHYRRMIEEFSRQVQAYSPEKSSFKSMFKKESTENPVSAWTKEKEASCYICNYFKEHYDRYLDTFFIMYQKDEEEKGRNKIWKAENITPSDLEKVICNGIPINRMGNLKKMSASILAKHFSQKRFSRQRITNILNHKFPVERFDLLTIEFFIVSQEMEDDDPYDRYHHFIEEAQGILKKCGMSEIYIVNPYECFLLMCLLTDCPLAVFSEIWEKSYEEGEDEGKAE